MLKKRIFLVISLLILLLGIPAGIILLNNRTIFRLKATNNNQPENVMIYEITDSSATISWTTKTATQGLINYGLSPTNLTLVQPEVAPAINHQVKLTRLLSGSTYYFTIKIGEDYFDNKGQPFTFMTRTKETTPTPTPIPTISSPTSSPTPLLTEEGFQEEMGTNNPTYDLNKDGVVNILDLLLFRQQKR